MRVRAEDTQTTVMDGHATSTSHEWKAVVEFTEAKIDTKT